MKSSKTFNNISDKLKATIPVLKPGETILFQMLNGVPNPEPDEKERSKSPVLYGKRQLQTSFRIFDPFIKNESGEEVGGYVDCGCVDQWNKDEPVTFRHFVPGLGEFSQFQGKFALSANNIRDVELYEILWISNEREGNPYRDKSVEPSFKIVDLKADSKASITRVSILKQALKIADELKTNPKKAKEVMASLNKSYQDPVVMEAELGNLASSFPEVLIKAYEGKDTQLKATVQFAMDAGILKHNTVTGAVSVGGVQIHTLKVNTADSFIVEMAKWLDTAENGKDVLNNIKSQMKEESVTK